MNVCVICVGIKYVRGGEIFEVRDEENVVLNDFSRLVQMFACSLTYIYKTFAFKCQVMTRNQKPIL